MSYNDELKQERLTLFNVCFPCLRSKKLRCKASDLAIVMYGKDEPHEYVLEKLVIKRVPLKIFGVEEDFVEYQKNSANSSKLSNNNEKEIAVTNLETPNIKAQTRSVGMLSKPTTISTTTAPKEEQQILVQQVEEVEVVEAPQVAAKSPDSSSNSDKSHYSNIEMVSYTCEPFAEPKRGDEDDELILKKIDQNSEEIVVETDERIAKMSPDLEKTIKILKDVKPRPVSIRGTPMPLKNQTKRLTPRNVEQSGIITKEAYNYAPCPKDNPLQGIHYSLNRSTFTPIVEEASKSVTTVDPKFIEEATSNYEDASVLTSPIPPPPPPQVNIDKNDNENSQVSSHCLGSFGSLRFKNFFKNSKKEKSGKKWGGDTDFSVYNAEVLTPKESETSKKMNVRWRIVINNSLDEKNDKNARNSNEDDLTIVPSSSSSSVSEKMKKDRKKHKRLRRKRRSTS